MAAFNYYGQNPYVYPVGYQPVFQQGNQPMNQPVNQPLNQPSIIWISSENEALSYPVAPNNAVTLWSTVEPVVYLKKADATGKPTLQTYDLVERVQAPPATGGKTVEYASKNDLVALAGAVKGFDELVGAMKADIETMKSDLYGVAGRKKPRKKEEDEEE